jgi:hypothetical protein
MTDVDQLLGAWREEILAEIATMQTRTRRKEGVVV